MSRSPRPVLRRRPRRPRGTILIMYALLLTVLLGFAGLVLDAGMLYYRKVQLQNLADSAVLAAAQRLNGTAEGITAAAAQAAAIAARARIGLRGRVTWQSAALRFADAPDAPASSWSPAGTAAPGVRYARVDIAELGAMRQVQPVLMALVGGAAAVDLGGVAIAGPTVLKVTPLAVCAMSSEAAEKRTSTAPNTVDELVEYGFRSGIGYNLLNLSPRAGASTGEYYLVDPVTPPGTAAGEATSTDAMVAPFLCSGTLAYTRIDNGRLNVRRPAAFNLWRQMNSRFGDYGDGSECTRAGAPPDRNVKSFGAATWMSVPPTSLTAKATGPSATEPLRTVADLPPPLATRAAGEYGIRWAYGPARLHPAGAGYAPAARWASLYPSTPAVTVAGVGAASLYPTGPYNASGSTHLTAPTGGPGRRNRRLLYVPLLDCSGPVGTQAGVWAIGRFLLTARASASEVPAEFAGVVGEAALGGGVELFR